MFYAIWNLLLNPFSPTSYLGRLNDDQIARERAAYQRPIESDTNKIDLEGLMPGVQEQNRRLVSQIIADFSK